MSKINGLFYTSKVAQHFSLTILHHRTHGLKQKKVGGEESQGKDPPLLMNEITCSVYHI